MTRGTLAALTLAMALVAGAADAQTPARAATAPPLTFRPWRPVLHLGGGFVGGESLGVRQVQTRTTTLGTLTPSGATIFRTDSSLDAGPRVEAAIALPVTRAFAVELVGTTSRRTLGTDITGDVEGAPASAATERIAEYTVGGRVTYALPRGPWRRRVRPFLAAGGAYLRQLHEDNVLVETGRQWTAGAGLHVWLRGHGARVSRPLGLTAEAGWQWRSGGISFVDGGRSAPVASLRVFAGF